MGVGAISRDWSQQCCTRYGVTLCDSVKYHSELLNYIDVPVLDLHVRPALVVAHNEADDSSIGQAEAAKTDQYVL